MYRSLQGHLDVTATKVFHPRSDPWVGSGICGFDPRLDLTRCDMRGSRGGSSEGVAQNLASEDPS